jgi:hypothetical protein
MNAKETGQPAPGDLFPYQGTSMHGTFRPGDLLLVTPVAIEAIHPGDVVAFRRQAPDEDAAQIVHRVQARVGAGLITRGDHSTGPDPSPVRAVELVGRVVAVQRHGRVRRVWGGPAGRLWALGLRFRRGLLRLAQAPYTLLRASGLVQRLWRPRLERVHLTTPEGPLVKTMHRGRTVAQWHPQTGRFWCRKPYDLVIERPAEGNPDRDA